MVGMEGDSELPEVLPERNGPRPRHLAPVKPYVMPDVTPADAEDQLQELIPDALQALTDCLDADSEHVKLGAAKLVLELTGVGGKGANANTEAAAIREQLERLLAKRLGRAGGE
jgi:hypothetical protein